MITFNNVYLTDAIPGLLITNIKRDILPPRAVNLIDIPARMGSYFLNVKNNVRTYTVDIALKGSTLEDVRLKMRDLAEILNTKGLAPLVFDDENYKTYQAIAVENTELDEVARLARGTITFLIPDPVGKGSTVSMNLGAAGDIHTITNYANSDVYPIFTVDFNSDAQFFSMISPDGFVLIGNPAGVEEVTKKPEEISLHDQCDDLTPWSSTGVQLDYPSAVNAGTMAVVPDNISGGYKFQPSSYGDDATYPDKWHGPAIKRSLPETLQDFELEAFVELYSGKNETGRIEIIFFDASGVALGKMVLWDRYPSVELNTGHIYAGSISDQHTIIDSWGPRKYAWNQFLGVLKVKRVGNIWSAAITKAETWGRYKYDTHLYKQIIINNEYTNPVASIQIHVSKYGSKPAANMSVRGIRVFKINTVLTDEVPTLFSAGDQLVIDHEKGACFLNGEYFNQHLDPASKFFKIAPGSTQVTSRTTDGADVNIKVDYVERWI